MWRKQKPPYWGCAASSHSAHRGVCIDGCLRSGSLTSNMLI